MLFKNLAAALFMLVTLIVKPGCSGSGSNDPCGASSSILMAYNTCLILDHSGLTDAHKALIVDKVSMGMTAINNLMPVDNLLIRIVDNPQLVIPELGIGGYNPNAQEVILGINADFNDLDGTLEENLIAQLAHEVHHAKRRRSVGYGNTLLQASVSEGLADHFSIEVTGIAPPPWAIALSGVELQNWIETASESWNESTYVHNAWFLGTDPSIPRWTGYTIGFELVKDYLSANPGSRPSTLQDEPANSFLP